MVYIIYLISILKHNGYVPFQAQHRRALLCPSPFKRFLFQKQTKNKIRMDLGTVGGSSECSFYSAGISRSKRTFPCRIATRPVVLCCRSHDQAVRRRQLVLQTCLAPIAFPSKAHATPLAPLGSIQNTGEKTTGLRVEQICEILEKDLSERQYFITGNLTTAIFDDACRFRDPTNDIVGLSRYKKALGLLFDPQNSTLDLISIGVVREQGKEPHIQASWMLGGYLKLPWNPYIRPFKGTSTYFTNEKGLISLQSQEWEISALDALLQTFTPSGHLQLTSTSPACHDTYSR